MHIVHTVTTAVPWWMPERPDAIYGAAIGGAIALLTAYLTNRNARKRQVLDIAHSSSEKDKERHYALRRETYLPLIEATANAVSFVAQIPSMPMEQLNGQQPMLELGRLIARLGLIAPTKVQKNVYEAHLLLTQISSRMFSERWGIENISSEISSLEFNVQLRLNRQKELQMRQEKHLDEKTGDIQLMQSLYEQHKSASKEIDDLLAKKDPLLQKRFKLQNELLKIVIGEIPSITRKNTEALITIREDLGLDTNHDWLRNFYSDISTRYSAVAADLQDQLETRFLGKTSYSTDGTANGLFASNQSNDHKS